MGELERSEMLVGEDPMASGTATAPAMLDWWPARGSGIRGPWAEAQNWVQFSSVQCSVVSDSLRLHESQHARPPCPSPTPGVYSNSCPLTPWCHPAISSSVVPLSSCSQSLPASVFSSESTLRMRWPKYWSFSFSISPSKQHPGLNSFRMDSINKGQKWYGPNRSRRY